MKTKKTNKTALDVISNKDQLLIHLKESAEQGAKECEANYKGVILRPPYTSELISCDELFNQYRAQAL
ncbi:hypothetical protein [Pseudoalteromonas sp. T1lg21]|uniref:hypothetical protein n=1 Tax=Pseudoalteromonas sp. T1lg21 TaxID=2077095 RepID=UPI000CF73A06|nr:hypothetical protein [Pseudoalteromonas sp. T1lg21]